MQDCFWPGFLSLSLALGAIGCGADDKAAPSEAEGSGEPSGMDVAGTGPQGEGRLFPIALEGSNQLLVGQARVEVVELVTTVKFILTATYPGDPDDLLLLQLALPGVESVAGPHTFELGRPYVADAFAIVALDTESYSSRDGTFELTLGTDGALDGRFEAGFSKDATDADHPMALPDREQGLSSSEALRMSGSFEGSWSLLCKSPVPSLPGDHSVSDSAYCTHLEF